MFFFFVTIWPDLDFCTKNITIWANLAPQQCVQSDFWPNKPTKCIFIQLILCEFTKKQKKKKERMQNMAKKGGEKVVLSLKI